MMDAAPPFPLPIAEKDRAGGNPAELTKMRFT
jgi:hypothetical protein